MLYLKASATVETMDNYNGKKGMFIKTFAVNDKRNKNGWRLDWQSIKRNISDFIKKPGIEYIKCTDAGCDLDHIDAATYQLSLKVQEPFRTTTITDYILDEDNHSSFFIHETDDADFFAKVNDGTIKYVSPSVWPISGAYDFQTDSAGNIQRMPNGEPIVDVYDWKALHTAFVNDPAFGEDAKVVATCEGHDCQMKMLTAKEMEASDELRNNFTDIPVLIKHNDHHVFVSLSAKASKEFDHMFDNETIRPCAKSAMTVLKNNSLNACSCMIEMSMTELELQTKLAASEKALKAATEEKEDKDKKIKDLESKIAKLEASAKKGCAKCGSEDHETDDHTEKNSAKNNEKEEKDEKAKTAREILKLGQIAARSMLEEMIKAREINGATTEEITQFQTAMKAKTFDQIESQYNDEKILLKSIKAKSELEHFEFNGGQKIPGALAAKSAEEIFDGGLV